MRITNALTLGRLAAAVILLAVFTIDTLSAKVFSLFLILFAQVSDFLDGYLARSRSLVTNFGKLFDPLADCIFFITLFGCFTLIGYMPVWMFLILLFRELMITSFLRPYFSYKKIVLSAKMSGKVKTAAQGIVANIVIVFLILNHLTSAIDGEIYKMISLWCFFIIIVLSLYSLTEYLRELKE